ncbi:exodeoxyribonuclease III [Rhodococcus sp. D2-41]|uniref:Exodeoxyribonuclease III n=1 Tax=Speluncibacter jeojiensis TaxID=2710754 RepID=A0A9X4M481_9ACTN|nr:exodeoxyribonuclease III [Rhodococcus sp. D2-41]MDG3008892.1 exodeoxyribonuclease III [Rhodococcus sp. D2-41]MDG3016514.1 exodeoxyribonuclease III [Corynebacteriales bacterium D3-21]
MPYILTTVNVNGVRAAAKKDHGLLRWLAATEADAVCLQETRADDKQLATVLAPVLEQGWHLASAEPAAKGRNGVAVLSRVPADAVRIGFGDPEFADSGRYLEADFGDLTVASLYLPSGEVGTERQDEKERFMASFGEHLAKAAASGRDVVVSGDWNIAHTERDLKNWKSNQKASGFLPEERQWLDGVFAEAWVDVVRGLHPDVDGPYSWWSYRGKAFDNDSGWRIDYQVATADLAERAIAARVERASSYDQRWSDHAPVTVEYR